MFQNIKVDIIYYDTPTDFELEFNLCGCCRMRLLTDKTDDQKLFLHMLARGVARSRIIILTGNLFGDDGIINLTSHAIGKATTNADKELYGILAEDEIKIIEGSVPLVTPDGYFGGCIIESGPQSMILLSDNKNIRKTIMQGLIHPYIEELSALALKEKAEQTKSSTPAAPEIEEQAEPQEETEENIETENISDSAYISPEPEVLDDTVEPISEIFDGKTEFEDTEDLSTKMFIEPSKVKYSKKSYYDEAYVPEMAQNFIFESDLDFRPINTVKRFDFSRLILILTILLLVLTATVCFCIFYFPSAIGSSPKEFILEIYKTLFGG